MYIASHLLRRAVKVPAPVYYASLAAERGMILLSGEDTDVSETQSEVS